MASKKPATNTAVTMIGQFEEFQTKLFKLTDELKEERDSLDDILSNIENARADLNFALQDLRDLYERRKSNP